MNYAPPHIADTARFILHDLAKTPMSGRKKYSRRAATEKHRGGSLFIYR